MSATGNNNDARFWGAVLQDRAAPPDLKAEARAKLGVSAHSLVVETAGGYDASLDPIVESYWHSRLRESELRDPVAERTYHALFYLIGLGGGPAAVEQVRWLLTVYPVCRSQWMQSHVRHALRVAGGPLNREYIPKDLAATLGEFASSEAGR
jgi:hypothetical protein